MRLLNSLGLFLFLLLFLFGPSVQGQNYEVSGVVKDSVTEEVLPLVKVFLQGSGKGLNTNLDGEFSFSVPAGEYILSVRFSGYEAYDDTLRITDQNLKNLTLFLNPLSTGLDEIIITSKAVNPAHRVVKRAIKQRRKNKFDKINAYEYEAYNKLVVTMDNVTDKFFDNKFTRGVGDVVMEVLGDSTHSDTSKYKLAAFVSESISRFYYKRPDLQKEEILAIRTSGVKGGEYNLLSSMFLQIEIYNNNVTIMDRDFRSPIADGAFLDYDFQLINTEIDQRDTLYGVQIIPKNPYDPLFQGTMYIDNKDWAINRIDIQLNDEPNVNYVEDIRIRQEYQKVDSNWVPTLLDLEVDFQNSLFKRKGGKGVGAIGRSSSYLYDYKLNKPKDPKFYKQELIEIKYDAEDKDSTFWAEHRKSPLDKSEILGYNLVDSLTSRGVLDFYINATEFLVWGTKKLEKLKIEVGPYFYILGFNQAEGLRTRLGVYTLETFHDRLYLGGHLAYGFRDKQFKYQVEAKYRLKRKPRWEIGLRKTYEVEQVGFDDFLNSGTSLLQTSLRRTPLTQLNYYHEHKITLSGDIMKGLAGDFYYRNKYFQPASTFDFGFKDRDDSLRRNYTISEVGMDLRISFKETYVTNGGDKKYIRTKYPVFNLGYRKGFSGFLDGDYDYHHAFLEMKNWTRLGRYGWLRYYLRGGGIVGDLPFPSLYVFRGNQSWGYDKQGFNLMNFYEFVADRYAVLILEHHLEGFFFNRVPLIRKLKWKEVLHARAAYGTLSPQNRYINNVSIPRRNGSFFNQIMQAPDQEPYVEAGVGITNIFKVIRVDAIWRLNYHDALQDGRQHRNWGRLNNFGIRADLYLVF